LAGSTSIEVEINHLKGLKEDNKMQQWKKEIIPYIFEPQKYNLKVITLKPLKSYHFFTTT